MEHLPNSKIENMINLKIEHLTNFRIGHLSNFKGNYTCEVEWNTYRYLFSKGKNLFLLVVHGVIEHLPNL